MTTTWRGWLMGSLMVGGATFAGLVMPSIVGTLGVRTLLFLLAALPLIAIGARSPRFAIWATVATFTFSGFARRIIPVAEAVADPAAIVPLLVAIPLAIRGARRAPPLSVLCLASWSALAAGFAFHSPLIGVAGLLNFVVPLLGASSIGTIPDGVGTLERAVVKLGAVAATYGIVQYLVPFTWDVRWLDRAKFVSAGKPGTTTFRPFATLPAPGTAAVLCAVVLLVIAFRRPTISPLVRGWAATACLMLLLLTQVRSVWIALAIAFLVGAARSRRAARRLLVGVLVFGVVLVVTPQRDAIFGRAATLTALGGDKSYTDRTTLLSNVGSLASPIGHGLGTASAGSRAGVDTSLDNGYIVVLTETGVIGLGLVGWVLFAMALAGSKKDRPFFVIYVLINSAGFAFGNVAAFVLWSFGGLPSVRRRQVDDDLAASTHASVSRAMSVHR